MLRRGFRNTKQRSTNNSRLITIRVKYDISHEYRHKLTQVESFNYVERAVTAGDSLINGLKLSCLFGCHAHKRIIMRCLRNPYRTYPETS